MFLLLEIYFDVFVVAIDEWLEVIILIECSGGYIGSFVVDLFVHSIRLQWSWILENEKVMVWVRSFLF